MQDIYYDLFRQKLLQQDISMNTKHNIAFIIMFKIYFKQILEKTLTYINFVYTSN